MNLYDILNKLNISYNEIYHEAVYTVDAAKNIKNSIEGIGCKNLFLTNKKGKYFLIMIEENKNVDIKRIASIVNVSHLSFASENDLKTILNLERGSVTPLGIINDINNEVVLLIDGGLCDKQLLVHPNVNTKTMSISFNDLIKFIIYTKHDYILI